MKVRMIRSGLKRKAVAWIMSTAFALGLFSGNVSQAAMVNTFTWIGGTNTNAANSANYTATVGNISGWNLAGSTNAYVYPGVTAQNGTQVLDYSNAASVYTYGLTVTNWKGDVVMTNLADWRVDSGGLAVTSSVASTLWIMASNGVGQLGGSPVTFSGNMSVYVTGLGGHSTTARTLTQNLTNLTISNLTVNAATVQASATPLTLSGTGNTTVVGSISNKTQFLSTGGNAGYLLVNSGTLNIATASSANTNWVSGLVLSNAGSVYVLGQLSLGSPMFDTKVGSSVATNRTTFGLINTSSVTSVALTNNFVIANTVAATNVFKAQSGKTLTLSGVVSGSVNGTVVADAGTLVLSGANTALSLPLIVTNNGTLVAANDKALGSSGVTVASGAALQIKASIANSIANSGSVVVADGGNLTSANTLTGLGSLSVGAASGRATFTSSLATGANNVGPLSLTGNGGLVLNAKSQISSTGALAVSGTENLITATGTASAGLNNLVVATSITGADASSIALTGSAVGNPPRPIALGSSFTDNSGNTYTFTKSDTALQVSVTGRGSLDLAFAGVDQTGVWNTNTSNQVWNTVPGGSPSAFYNGDNAAFTNSATVTVDNSGVSPNTVSFSNPVSSSVSITGGPINAVALNGNGGGNVNVSSDLTSLGGITINSGNVTLAKTTVNAGGITVAGGSLNSSGSTTITSGGLTVQGGSLSNSGTTTLSGGALNVSSGSLDVSGSISAGVVNVTGGSVSGSGSVTGTSYNVANANYNVALAGANPLTVSGTSTLGNANSGYSGAVSIPGGNVSLTSLSSLGSGGLSLGGTLDLGGNSVNMSSVNLSANAALNNGTLNVTSATLTYDLLGSGTAALSVSNAIIVNTSRTNTVSTTLTGTAALNKSSTGRLLLTVANSFSGGTTISSGDIYIGDSSSLGSGTVTISSGTNVIRAMANNLNVANRIVISTANSALQPYTTNTGWKLTLSGNISGPGSIYHNSSDNLYLTDTTNSFGGGIKMNSSGTLYVPNLGMTGSNSSVGTNAAAITATGTNAPTVRWNGVVDETSDKNFVLSGTNSTGSGIKIYSDGVLSSLTLTGNITTTLTNNQSIALGAYNGNKLIMNGQIVQAGGMNALTVGTSQSGTVALNNPTNNISGGVTISTPTVSTITALSVPFIGNAGQASSLGTNGTINISTTNNTATAALVYTGTGETSDKSFKFMTPSGTLQLEQAGTGPLKYTGVIGSGSASNAVRAINLVAATNTVAELATDLGDMGGTNSLAKSGAGSWALSGNNSYNGTTTVTGGTLVLKGTDSGNGNTTITSGTLDVIGVKSGSGGITLSSASSILKISQTNGLANGYLAGGSSTTNIGTVNLTGGGDYSIGSYGNPSTAGANMNFTNSSGVKTTLTFTAPINYFTVSTAGSSGRYLTNSSTDLLITFSGAVDIGSSVANDLTFAAIGDIAVKGAIFNNGSAIRGIVKTGTGKLTLYSANTYNGSTMVTNGTLVLLNANAIPSGTTATVSSNSVLQVNAAIANTIINNGRISLGDGGEMKSSQITGVTGGTLELAGVLVQPVLTVDQSLVNLKNLNYGGNGNISMPIGAKIIASGLVGINGTQNKLNLVGNPAPGVTYQLVTGSTLTVSSDAAISAVVNGQEIALGGGAKVGNTYCSFVAKDNQLLLIAAAPDAQILTYNDTINGGWNINPSNNTWYISNTTTPASFFDNDSVVFNGTGSTAVTVSGTVQPAAMTLMGPSGNLTFQDGTIKVGSMSSSGAGSVTIGSSLEVAGTLEVSNGSLTLNSSVKAGTVKVTGGTLGGSGDLTADLYSLSGGTVNVGLKGGGTLNLSGSVVMGGDNSGFTGPVVLSGGSVSLTGNSSLGSGVINLSGGAVLNLNTDGMSLGNAISLGSGGGTASVPSGQKASLTGAITNVAGNANLTLSKIGGGQLTLSGTVGSTTPSYVALNISAGDLVLNGGQKYLTNLVVNTGSRLVLDNVTVNSRGGTNSGNGTIEVTNNVTLTNTGGSNLNISNAVNVAPGGVLTSVNSSGSTFTYFYNGINGSQGSFSAAAGGGSTNRIGGISTIGAVNIDSGAALRIITGTLSNTTVTNNGKFMLDNSSGILALIGTNVTGTTTNYAITLNGDISGSGVISLNGSKDVVLAGVISGGNSISIETASSAAFSLMNSNSFTGGVKFITSTGGLYFSNSNALGTGAIWNSGNSPKATVGMLGTNQLSWTINNDIYTGSSSAGVMAFQAGSSNTLTLEGLITGGGQLKVTSSAGGELRVNNMGNWYYGGTEVGTGTIAVTNSQVLGYGAINFGTTTNSILRVMDDTTFDQSFTIGSYSTNTSYENSAYINVDSGKNATLNQGVVKNSLYATNPIVCNLNKIGQGTLTLKGINSYNGKTDIQSGLVVVSREGALPTNPTSSLAVSNNATIKFAQTQNFSLGAMTVVGNLEQNLITITSLGAVDLTGSTLTVNGTPSASSYTLVTGTSLTGTPTLSPAISGYALRVSGNNLLLEKVATDAYALYLSNNNLPAGTAFNAIIGGVTVGLKYAFASASGMPQNNGEAAVPVITQLPNGDQQMTYTFDVKTDSALTVKYQTSTDLVTWTTAQDVSPGAEAAPSGFLKRQVVVTGSDKLFVRINVTR